MGLLHRLLGIVGPEDRKGLRLQEVCPWQVSSTGDAALFLGGLHLLRLEDATIYLEATYDRAIRQCLERVSVEPRTKVAVGTLWPRPDVWHVPFSTSNVEDLTRVCLTDTGPRLCDHVLVYQTDGVMLQWYDAFTDAPMLLSRRLDADDVRRFAQALGGSVLGA
jgi:hypothetical protein